MVVAGFDLFARGDIYLFTKPAGGWIDATETATVSAVDDAPRFGAAVAIAGETLVVGALAANSADKGAVYVLSPVTQKIDDLASVLAGFGLPAGTSQSLKATLDSIKKAAADGDVATACSALNAFINEVKAQQGKKKLTSAQAQQLISAAMAIETILGCV